MRPRERTSHAGASRSFLLFSLQALPAVHRTGHSRDGFLLIALQDDLVAPQPVQAITAIFATKTGRAQPVDLSATLNNLAKAVRRFLAGTSIELVVYRQGRTRGVFRGCPPQVRIFPHLTLHRFLAQRSAMRASEAVCRASCTEGIGGAVLGPLDLGLVLTSVGSFPTLSLFFFVGLFL